MSVKILAIDPANEQSAWVIIDSDTYEPITFEKVSNKEIIRSEFLCDIDILVIEMVACYGMAVGKEVFETCVWIGRFIEHFKDYNAHLIYRKDVKMNLCGSMKAKDANIRQALIDRFGVVGTKNNQGWFYGFHSDIWSAYAVGVTYIDEQRKLNNTHSS